MIFSQEIKTLCLHNPIAFTVYESEQIGAEYKFKQLLS